LTLYWVMLPKVVHHSSTSTYTPNVINPFTARPEKNVIRSQCMGNANTAGSIISHTTVISRHIAYLASPDSSGSLESILFPLPEISGWQGSERVGQTYVRTYNTHGRTDEHLRPTLLGRLRRVDLKMVG